MDNAEKQAAEVVEKYGNQEVLHLLDRLAEMGIGRPLYVVQKKSALSNEEQARVGVTTPEETVLIKVGHALPANEDETSHIIIAPDGSMMYIVASHASEMGVNHYKNLFSVAGTELLPDYFLPQGTNQTILDTLREKSLSLPIASIFDGRMPEQYAQVKEKFGQALIIAQKRKEAIEATNLQMKKDVSAGLKNLLNPPPPPAAPPPATT